MITLKSYSVECTNEQSHYAHLLTVLLVCLGFGLLTLSQGYAAPVSAGRVIAMSGNVKQRFDSPQLVPTTPGTPVVLNQHMITSEKSRVQMRLRDGSQLRLGPVSVFTMDDFIYAPTHGLGGKAVTLHRGSLSYFSGVGVYDSQLSLLTPVATVTGDNIAINGFHIPGLGSAFTVIKGTASVETRFDDMTAKSGQTVVVGPDGRGGMAPSDVPPAMALEIIRYTQAQITIPGSSERIRIPRNILAQEAADNLTDIVSQRADAPQTPSLTPGDWPTNTVQAQALEAAGKQMPLLAKAQRTGLLDQRRDSEDRKASFARDTHEDHPNAARRLGQNTDQLNQSATQNQEQAIEEVIDGFEAQNATPDQINSLVAGAVAATPEHATKLANEAIDTVDQTDAASIGQIASTAARSAPEQMNTIMADAIKALPPEQQADKAAEIVQDMMSNVRPDSTAQGDRANADGPAPLEELPPEVQKAIASELKAQGFEQSGQTPSRSDDTTPSAETSASKPQTPRPGSPGGHLDIIAFLTSANFIIGLIVVVVAGGFVWLFYRINANQKQEILKKRKRQLSISRKQSERQADLNKQVEELSKS